MLGFIWIPSPIHLAVDGMGEARPILLSKFYLLSPRQIELISIFLGGLLLCACKLIKTFPFIRELFHAQKKKKKRSFPLLLWDPTFCWTSGEGSVNPSFMFCVMIFLAQQVWSSCQPLHVLPAFPVSRFTGRNIVYNRLPRAVISGEASWDIWIVSTCWQLWNWRNAAVFDPSFSPPSNPLVVLKSIYGC
jgi:hypothetical protein